MVEAPETKPYGTPLFRETLVESTKPIIKEQLEKEWEPPNYCIFSAKSVSYCIGLVDMASSTKIAAGLRVKMSRYYQQFLNLMSKVVAEFDGKIIKNVGDCLLYYFPETTSSQDRAALTKSLECSLTMIDSHEFLRSQMKSEGLPPCDYRISMDYGFVMLMKSADSNTPDMIGPPLNMCAKINRCAEKNGIVIGGDLYQLAKHSEGFLFKELKAYPVGFKYSYPIYQVTRRML